MWDHMYGFEKQYRCAYNVDLLPCLDLEIIIIYRDVGAPEHGKYVVDA